METARIKNLDDITFQLEVIWASTSIYCFFLSRIQLYVMWIVKWRYTLTPPPPYTLSVRFCIYISQFLIFLLALITTIGMQAESELKGEEILGGRCFECNGSVMVGTHYSPYQKVNVLFRSSIHHSWCMYCSSAVKFPVSAFSSVSSYTSGTFMNCIIVLVALLSFVIHC